MNVKELKEILKNVDDDRIVIMAIDEEGNGFSPLHELDDESSYSSEGDVGIEKLTPELETQGYTEEDVVHGLKALVLWPL